MSMVRASTCAIMSSRPVKGVKTVAKWPYQWESECAHRALRKERLAMFVAVGQILPGAQETQGAAPNQPGGRPVCRTTGTHSRLPDKHIVQPSVWSQPPSFNV